MTTPAPTSPGLPTWVAVRGRDAASTIYDVLDTMSPSTPIQPPRLGAPGWWLMECELAPADAAAVGGHLASSTALMLQGGVADLAALSVFELGRAPANAALGLPAELADAFGVAGVDQAVEDWIRRLSPKRLSAKSQAKLWAAVEGYNGAEIAEAVLRKLGFSVTARDPISLCAGCIAELNGNHNIVGETYVDWRSVRWFTGLGEDDQGRWIGLWDLDAPGEAVQRWPRSPQGAMAADEMQWQLVALPIVQATRLNGRRRWTPLAGWSAAPAAFYHYSPDQRLSIVLALERPFTQWASYQPGYATGVSSEARDAVGLDTQGWTGTVAIPDQQIAERIAWGQVQRGVQQRWGHDPSPWRDIPDDVPRGFLETAAWVRQQALQDGHSTSG